MEKIYKYPRTQHIEGSKLQPGDEDLSQKKANSILGKHIVIEEKVDGANTAISFDNEGNLLLQSRGHYLTGGYRERHYNLFKQWANIHKAELYNILGTRYILYGEWLYAKHTIYYDSLPHYFLEFDIYDRDNNVFLDTTTRHNMLKNSCVISVKVLATGEFKKFDDILKYLGNSNYKTNDFITNLKEDAKNAGYDEALALRETDNSLLMEGLYIKVEENGIVTDRMKYVRYTFTQAVTESNTHWLDRTIIPNKLKIKIEDLF